MLNTLQTTFAAIGATLPAAMLVWRAGNLLVERAGNGPRVRRLARIGTVAAGMVGVGAVVLAIASSTQSTRRHQTRLDDRLDGELEDSFPASDAPSVTRSSASR